MSFINWNAYILHCTYIRPKPKAKYAICVSSNEKHLFFFINTEPRKLFDPDSQVKVSPTELPFLKYDSFINAADTITCIVGTTCTVKKHFGPIPDELKNRIKSIVKNSETLSSRFIQDILMSE